VTDGKFLCCGALALLLAGCGGDDVLTPTPADDDDDTLDGIAQPCVSWSARYDHGIGENDLGSDGEMDSRGRAYVTARSVDGDCDFVTSAYDVDGQRLWSTRMSLAEGDLLDVPKDLDIDETHGVVYVVGESVLKQDLDMDCVVVAYHMESGDELWTVTFSSQPGAGMDMCKHSGLDDRGRLHVVGLSRTTDETPATPFTFVLDHDGEEVRDVDPVEGEAYSALPYNMVVSGEGDAWVTGQLDPGPTGMNVWAARVAEDGRTVWWHALPGGGADVGDALFALGPDGTVFHASSSRDEDGPFVVRISALDPDGKMRWSIERDAGWAGGARKVSLAADDAGGVYWALSEPADGSTSQCVTHHHDAQGDLVWDKFMRLPDHDCMPMDLVVDGEGRLTLSGSLTGPDGARYFLHRLDGRTGDAAWTELGQEAGSWGEINSLTLDGDGNLLASGTADSAGSAADAIALKRCADYVP